MATIKRTFLIPFFLSTQDHAVVQSLREISSISDLRKDWASIVVTRVECTVFQIVPCSNDEISTGGLLYAGLVPSDWTVPKVLEKMTIANELVAMNCTYEEISSAQFVCDLSTFETDLALKDRRGALPRLAIASFGVCLSAANPTFHFSNLKVTVTLECSGQAYGA
jgi:hypothetical protein